MVVSLLSEHHVHHPNFPESDSNFDLFSLALTIWFLKAYLSVCSWLKYCSSLSSSLNTIDMTVKNSWETSLQWKIFIAYLTACGIKYLERNYKELVFLFSFFLILNFCFYLDLPSSSHFASENYFIYAFFPNDWGKWEVV